jgi:hypothetical protein
MIDFAFVIPSDPKEARFYSKVASVLDKKGFSCAFVTTSANAKGIIEREGFACLNVYDLAWEYGIGQDGVEKRVAQIKRKYGIPDMEKFVLAEKMYWDASTGELEKKAALVFPVLERFTSENRIRCFVQNSGGEIMRRAVYRVAKLKGIRNFFIIFAAVPGKRSLLFRDEAFVLDDLRIRSYGSMKKDERDFTEEMIRKFRSEKRVFGKHKSAGRLAMLPKPFRHVRAEIKKMSSDDPVLLAMGLKNYRKKGKQLARRFLFRKSLYKTPVSGEKYVFFPLHVTNDSQITMRAQQFMVQEDLISKVSDVLPKGYMLYVKPHPGCYLYSYRKLRKCVRKGNVRLIEPAVNAHGLIKGAEGVITINSSVGLESLFYFKPVLTLGRPFYRGHGVTVDVDGLSELSHAIRRLLRMKPDEERIKAFIFSVYKATWPGIVYDNSSENISELAGSIAGKLRKMEG